MRKAEIEWEFIGIMTFVIIICAMFFFMMGLRAGQVDAQTGNVYMKLYDKPNGEKAWGFTWMK